MAYFSKLIGEWILEDINQKNKFIETVKEKIKIPKEIAHLRREVTPLRDIIKIIKIISGL